LKASSFVLKVLGECRLRIGVRTSEDGNFNDSEMLQAAGLMPKSGRA